MLSRNVPTVEARSIVNGFAQRITDSILTPKSAAANTIVSVHNNTDGAYSSLSHLPDSTNALGVRDIYINSSRDPDDFFYVTRRFDFNYLKNYGYNVILQDNKYIKDDGSLSVYCGKNRTRYINIEAEHHHLEQQMQMLYTVHELLKKVTQTPPPLAMLKPVPPKNDEKTTDKNTDKTTSNTDSTQKTAAKTPETLGVLLEEMPEDLP